jgi:DNA-binding NtrC family response regulator
MEQVTETLTPTPIQVLAADDDENDLRQLSLLLSAWNYKVETASDGEQAYEKLSTFPAQILITDLKMPRMDGFELLQKLKSEGSVPLVIVLTSFGSIDAAVNAVHDLGVFWFLEKPVQPNVLRTLLERASMQIRLASENASLLLELSNKGSVADMVGATPAMQKLFWLIQQIAPSTASVLITGESGTGKELVARAIHALSPRKNGPFVAVNCAALPESLVESELFGHERGAFTGAIDRRAGCLELANGGTLLLDEIGDLPMPAQAKLLRVLEDGRVRRIGGKNEIQLDVRVLSATNRNPDQFRKDLYYRLNVFQLAAPPLRERKGDLPLLCDYLLDTLNKKHHCRVVQIHPDVMEKFQQYSWPGNVRELRNVLESAVILKGEGTLTLAQLPAKFAPHAGVSQPAEAVAGDVVTLTLGSTVDQAERALIEFTLQHTNNNKTQAAKILGISLKTLHCKIKRYKALSHVEAAG